MTKHIKIIHSQGTYQHCDFFWRPNPFVADIDNHTKNIHSQCTFQHCDCCIKPNKFGADMKKHIYIYSQVDIRYMQSRYSTIHKLCKHIFKKFLIEVIEYKPLTLTL